MRYRRETSKREVKQGGAGNQLDPETTEEWRQDFGEMHHVFDRSSTGLEAGRDLMWLCQGNDSVLDYVSDVGDGLRMGGASPHRRVPPGIVWGSERGTPDLPEDLDRIIAMAIRSAGGPKTSIPPPTVLAAFYPQAWRDSAQSTVSSPGRARGDDGGPLSDQQWGEGPATENTVVLLLGRTGPLRLELPGKRAHPLMKRGALVGVFKLESSTKSRTCLPVTLEWPGEVQKTSALLDSWRASSTLKQLPVGEFP